MKILAINGSHRGNRGMTAFCLARLMNGAEQAGAACETIHLASLKISACTGCQRCHTEEKYLHCVFEDSDDVKSVFEKMREADLIVFATPVYIFSMSSLLKRLLERINSTGDSSKISLSAEGLFFHDIDRAVCSKPFALVVCYDNIEHESCRNIRQYFRTYARFMDARFAGTIIRRSAMVLERAAGTESVRTDPTIRAVCDALTEAGKELATAGRITRGTARRAGQSLIPMPTVVKLLMKIRFVRKRMMPILRERAEFQ